MNLDSKSPDDIELDQLREGIRHFIKQFGKIGLIRIVREIVYCLEDEYDMGLPFFLEAISDYSTEESDRSAPDVKVTWRRVARQLRYVVQEALVNSRRLP